MQSRHQSPAARRRPLRIELPTLVLTLALYGVWAVVTAGLSALGPWLGVLILAPVLTLHSSLQHE
ncbi:MAG: fatty acid desaturase, partial [Alphaproteobacteria bacterium]